jgi:hypothetical protein
MRRGHIFQNGLCREDLGVQESSDLDSKARCFLKQYMKSIFGDEIISFFTSSIDYLHFFVKKVQSCHLICYSSHSLTIPEMNSLYAAAAWSLWLKWTNCSLQSSYYPYNEVKWSKKKTRMLQMTEVTIDILNNIY